MTVAFENDFMTVAEPFRRELLAHCYRMTGSASEAEDLVQETYLRAWRSYDRFEGRSSVRTWLHRIATNVCLTNLEGRHRRPLPTGLGAPSSNAHDDLVQRDEVPWLEPISDDAIGLDDPAGTVVTRDSVRLAFVAALQHLSARQRAVLILREVLQWSAAEVAEQLSTSVAAVNSLLQRARTQLGALHPDEDSVVLPDSAATRALLAAYVANFENYDFTSMAELFTREAVWEMPPFEGWYQGPDAIVELFRTACPAEKAGDLHLVPASANGQPALGLYLRAPDGVYRPFQLQVLDVVDGQIRHAVAFFDTQLFRRFGLPQELGTPH
ncbi:MAG: sigma-70 family RNA polymerase sigma factor [Propionibacteriaceae bacterium]